MQETTLIEQEQRVGVRNSPSTSARSDDELCSYGTKLT